MVQTLVTLMVYGNLIGFVLLMLHPVPRHLLVLLGLSILLGRLMTRRHGPEIMIGHMLLLMLVTVIPVVWMRFL
ncbi:MAG: hypothetical protein A2Y12_05365 [Planctomycetes bacterium GWF2_42_9]|nr:MAG: hypothetical protein A2Y12_05365 [Planctomycetes bacterium GWF2_42_9]